jgi:hypothetical protein
MLPSKLMLLFIIETSSFYYLPQKKKKKNILGKLQIYTCTTSSNFNHPYFLTAPQFSYFIPRFRDFPDNEKTRDESRIGDEIGYENWEEFVG